ncbi:MAG: nucleotidyl transferase AbiEii/AbiGii toxin family protein [Clostridia bacterium]|nr:nucleotidyl transferase AbiEii/AbiGii toxin family protein [Clostridia bacterium]
MIKTTRQLKDKVRNLSGGDSTKAQALIRNYIMEQFLLRISLSDYRNNLILKGGMLVSSVAGLNLRSTMDIDTTIKALNLSRSEATEIIKRICSVPVEDNISFSIVSVTDIMEEHDYPGIRFMLEAKFESLVQPVKIDISAGDVITPSAIEYEYKPMFDEVPFNLLSYNIETLLAEKLETIISRGTDNTRMRDFYDIHIITGSVDYDISVLKSAVKATVLKRNSNSAIEHYSQILDEIRHSISMQSVWESYVSGSYFIDKLSWNTVCDSVANLANAAL